MPNPYHDSQGRFASRDELKGLVDQAYKDGDMSTYIRERANLEEIEREIERERLAAGSTESSGIFSKASASTPKNRDMSTFERASEADSRVGTTMDWSIGELSPYEMEDADPYRAGDSEEKYAFSDEILDSYVALSNSTSHYDRTIDFNSVMNNSLQYWPIEKDKVEAGFSEDDSPSFEINPNSLVVARREATVDYANQMSEYRARLKHADNLETEAEAIREEVRASRTENLETLKKSKFELAYLEDQFTLANDDPAGGTEARINSQMCNIQTAHDSVIYSHAAERAIDRYMSSQE